MRVEINLKREILMAKFRRKFRRKLPAEDRILDETGNGRRRSRVQ
jgi:hypothetical protein